MAQRDSATFVPRFRNCQDLFAIVLMVARYEILDLTGVLADGACADAADLIPGLVTEGEYCLATGLQLRTGVIVLGAAAAAQWLALGAVHKLVSIDREDQPYYPLPQAKAGGLSRTVTATWGSGVKAALWGADELAIARDAIDTSHGDGAVWAHDAPAAASRAQTDKRGQQWIHLVRERQIRWEVRLTAAGTRPSSICERGVAWWRWRCMCCAVAIDDQEWMTSRLRSVFFCHSSPPHDQLDQRRSAVVLVIYLIELGGTNTCIPSTL